MSRPRYSPAEAATAVPRLMRGRLSSDKPRDGGRFVHLVPRGGNTYARAICNARPGLRDGHGWSGPLEAATCPRCLARLAAWCSP